MPIKVECQSCGHRYQVGDAMAGKKVKCKTCSAIIAIPSGENFEYGAVEVEATAAAPAQSAAPNRARAMAARQFEDDADPPRPDDEEPAAPTSAPAVAFPGSEVAESILPFVLAAGGLGWMALQAFHAEDPAHGWVGPFRAAMYLLVYSAVVFPICIMGVKAARTKAYFALPDGYAWRTFAAFCLPGAFAAVFTLISPSVMMFCAGLLVGLVVSIGAYIFLFNLSSHQIGKAVSVVVGYVIGGTVLGAAVLFGLSFLVQAMLSFSKSAHEYPGNPLGPQFAWNATPPADEPVKKKTLGTSLAAVEPATQPVVAEATTQPAATQPVEPATTQLVTAVNPMPAETQPTQPAKSVEPVTPAPPVLASPLLAAAPAPLPLGEIEDAYFAGQSGGSTVLALTAHTQFGDAFELWDSAAGDWKKISAFNVQQKTADKGGIVLNAKGTTMARLVEFPHLTIEVRPISKDSAADQAQARRVEPDAIRSTGLSLLGFTSNGFIMAMTCGPDGMLDVYDPRKNAIPGSPGAQLARAAINLNGVPPGARCNVAINPDARFLATVRYNKLSGKAAVGNYIVLSGIAGVNSFEKLTLTGLQSDRPIAVTGLAFSPDGSKVALLYQENGQGLIEIYKLADGKLAASKIFLGPTWMPIADFHGSALTWLADGSAMLINGRYVISADDFSEVGDLSVENVKAQHVIDRENLLLLVNNPANAGKAEVLAVKLDAAKFHPGAATKPNAGHTADLDVRSGATLPLR